MTSSAHAHLLIAKTAQDLTRELYSQLMRDNVIFSSWKSQHPGLAPKGLENAFVKKYWKDAIPSARATLSHMLTLPIDDDLKESISEALILDHSLVKGRKDPAKVIGQL